MQSRFLSSGLIGLTLAACAMAATPALARKQSYNATLTGAQEVPPTASKGTGTAKVSYNTATKKLKWTVTYSGLSGPATAAHFHGPAEPGKNADVVVPITGTASPMAGSATLTDAQAADLASGKWYINVHTAENKDGEIRGVVKKK